MIGERFRDPATIRLLLGCHPAGHVITCYCNADRCNNKTIGGSEWSEFIGGHSPGTTPDDDGSNGLPGTKPGDGVTDGLPGTKPKQPGKASFAPVTSPFGHVIMAVALFVTIVIGYLL